MKIEGHRPNAETSAARRLEGKESPHGSKAGGDKRQTDRVEVSREASFVGEAYRAADGAPEIRQHVVERARLRLEAGEVGRDAGKLAESLIDHMLSR